MNMSWWTEYQEQSFAERQTETLVDSHQLKSVSSDEKVKISWNHFSSEFFSDFCLLFFEIFICCILENMDASETFAVAMTKIMPIRSNYYAIFLLFLETRKAWLVLEYFTWIQHSKRDSNSRYHLLSVVFVLPFLFEAILNSYR